MRFEAGAEDSARIGCVSMSWRRVAMLSERAAGLCIDHFGGMTGGKGDMLLRMVLLAADFSYEERFRCQC